MILVRKITLFLVAAQLSLGLTASQPEPRIKPGSTLDLVLQLRACMMKADAEKRWLPTWGMPKTVELAGRFFSLDQETIAGLDGQDLKMWMQISNAAHEDTATQSEHDIIRNQIAWHARKQNGSDYKSTFREKNIETMVGWPWVNFNVRVPMKDVQEYEQMLNNRPAKISPPVEPRSATETIARMHKQLPGTREYHDIFHNILKIEANHNYYPEQPNMVIIKTDFQYRSSHPFIDTDLDIIGTIIEPLQQDSVQVEASKSEWTTGSHGRPATERNEAPVKQMDYYTKCKLGIHRARCTTYIPQEVIAATLARLEQEKQAKKAS